jgi:chromosome segregation ATPase
MAVVEQEIGRIKREAADTLEKNRVAVAASEQSVGSIQETLEQLERKVRALRERLEELGVKVDQFDTHQSGR